jgi:hypothetical protein
VTAANSVHHFLHDLREAPSRTGWHGLAGLEEDVGVLGRAAQRRGVGVRPRLRKASDVLLVDQGPEILVGQQGRSC